MSQPWSAFQSFVTVTAPCRPGRPAPCRRRRRRPPPRPPRRPSQRGVQGRCRQRPLGPAAGRAAAAHAGAPPGTPKGREPCWAAALREHAARGQASCARPTLGTYGQQIATSDDEMRSRCAMPPLPANARRPEARATRSHDGQNILCERVSTWRRLLAALVCIPINGLRIRHSASTRQEHALLPRSVAGQSAAAPAAAAAAAGRSSRLWAAGRARGSQAGGSQPGSSAPRGRPGPIQRRSITPGRSRAAASGAPAQPAGPGSDPTYIGSAPPAPTLAAPAPSGAARLTG